MEKSIEIAPFYVGQKVIAVDAMEGSKIKNGRQYIVNSCEYRESGNPLSQKDKKYWYVGVEGHHNRLRPGIFAPIEENFISISAEKILEKEIQITSAN